MAKQTVNLGTSPNAGDGDNLRAAFNKINANFTELYTALGLSADTTLNLGAFEFNGSTMTTTDSTPIVVDQAVTVTSDLTVGGDILPSVANGGNLGSAEKPFRSLYVSNNTVFLGGVSLGLEAGTNELRINNVPISQTITYADIPNVPADISDLTDTGNLLSQGNTGDITFANSTISAGNENEIIVQAKDDSGFATARLNLEPEYSTGKLSAFSSESVQTYTSANGDFATGVWQDNGFGNGVVAFSGAQNIGDFFQNTLQGLNPDNVTITINSEPAFTWNGGTSGSGTSTPGFGTNPIVPASPITITSITFTYRSESYISVNYDNQEIRLDAQNAGIRIDATSGIQMYGDSEIDLQADTYLRLSAGENIDIGTGSSYSVNISTGDFSVSAFDDINIRGNDSFRLRNESPTAPIRIITDDDDNEYTWAFNADGTLTFPDATIQTTAYTGPQTSLTGDVRGSVFGDDSTLLVDGVNSTIPYSVLSGAPSFGNWTFDDNILSQGGTDHAVIQASDFAGAKLILKTRGPTAKEWEFDQDGDLTLPGNGEIVFKDNSEETGRIIPSVSDGGGLTVQAEIDLEIKVNDGEGGSSTWSFESGGRLYFPDNTFQTTAYTGSSSSTGDVTFSGVKIIGAGTASGDGLGYSTLELVPDDDLYANDQYLVIDPTDPSHIHIRAGGTQDDSQAELYLGGEVNYVRVVDGTGVRLQNQTRDNNSYLYIDPTFTSSSWFESNGIYFVEYTTADAELIDVTFQFDADSENTLVVTYNAGANTALLTSSGIVEDLGGGVYRVSVNEAPPASPTAITALEYTIWTTNTNSVVLQSNDFNVSVTDDIRITGNDLFSLRNTSPDEPIEIVTNYDGASKMWEFAADGTLETPGDIIVSGDITGTSGSSTLYLKAQPDSNTYIQLNDSVDSTINTFADLEIITDAAGTAKTWTFGTDGSLTLPADDSIITIPSESLNGGYIKWTVEDTTKAEFFLPDDDDGKVFMLGTGEGVPFNLVVNGEENAKGWTFGTDGNLSAPGDIITEGNIEADAATFTGLATFQADEDYGVFIDQDGLTLRNNGSNIYDLAAGPGGGSINTGLNKSFAITTDDNNYFFGFGDDGTLTLPGDIKSEGNINIDINLSDSTLRRWTFGEDGILNLPEGGDIVDSTGTSVLGGGGSGSVLEETFEDKTSATGVIEHDATTNRLFRHTSISANFTANFTNLGLEAGKATSLSLVLVQGATARMCTAVQIGGAAQTIIWQGSASAPAGNANRTDVVTFSILCTATDTYTVLGMLTSFGG